MDHARRGETALSAGKYDEAVSHYNEALKQSPSAATYYIKRSTAHQRSQKHAEALSDAEIAVVLATKRAKRELISQAQLRRGIALFNVGRFGDASFCFALARKFDPNDKQVGMWEAKVNEKLKGLPENDEVREVTVEEVPDVAVPDSSKPANGTAATNNAPSNAGGASRAAVLSQTNAPAQTPASRIRHEWYQNSEMVYFTLLVKGAPPDKVAVDIHERSLFITFPLQSGSSFDFSLDPLFAAVDPSRSKHRLLSTKIEVTLQKAHAGQKWPAMEGTAKPNDESFSASSTAAAIKPEVSPLSNTSAPSYPTSSRSGPKNWDKIANSYVKPASVKGKDSGDDSKENDDDYINEFDDGGDDVNGFFKQIFARADPDMKRAMMKSYQESAGTALSTNWSEVKNKKYEIEPPEGVEVKKWGS